MVAKPLEIKAFFRNFANSIAHSKRNQGADYDSLIDLNELDAGLFMDSGFCLQDVSSEHHHGGYPNSVIKVELDELLAEFGFGQANEKVLNNFIICLCLVLNQTQFIGEKDSKGQVLGDLRAMIAEGTIGLDLNIARQGTQITLMSAKLDGFDGESLDLSDKYVYALSRCAGDPLKLAFTDFDSYGMSSMAGTKDCFIELSLSGSGYSAALEREVAASIETDATVFLRGSRAPAAGFEDALNIVLSFISDISADARAAVVSLIIVAAWDALVKIVGSKAGLTSVEFRQPDYDIQIVSPDGLNNGSAIPDFNDIISRIDAFVQKEKQAGRSIVKVELPNETGGLHGYEPNCGSYNLWLVHYRDGERWPFALYDAANECFLMLDSSTSTEN